MLTTNVSYAGTTDTLEYYHAIQLFPSALERMSYTDHTCVSARVPPQISGDTHSTRSSGCSPVLIVV